MQSNGILAASMKRHKRSIFLFHRDLRLIDNTALLQACEESEEVIPLFVFTESQIQDNEYASLRSIQFMVESLQEVDQALIKKGGALWSTTGNASDVLRTIITTEQVDAVYSNYDYTPFSQNRDNALKKVVEAAGAIWIQTHDALLHIPGTILNGSGEYFKVFTPFYKKALLVSVEEPVKKIPRTAFVLPQKKFTLDTALQALSLGVIEPIVIPGGRKAALKILKDVSLHQRYQKERDFPALEKTTHLSAHNKFGTVSIREVYWTMKQQLGLGHGLTRQLYWRDFFYHVAVSTPVVFGTEFQEKYRRLPWGHGKKQFQQWCEGKTGFPIVDAGMRELNETGYMHNRSRMIVASFLTKDLRIDWRWGEKYFAQQLIDYDPCVNNGSWQWAASTGCDAQPYFRIFNPWSQQKRFDSECVYIKKWVPELRELSPKEIHALETQPSLLASAYPAQMVNHKEEREKTLAWFKKHTT